MNDGTSASPIRDASTRRANAASAERSGGSADAASEPGSDEAGTRLGWRRVLRGALLAIGTLVAAVQIAIPMLIADAWRAMGTAPEGARLERMQASPNWDDDESKFVNVLPMTEPDLWEALQKTFDKPDHSVPSEPPPVVELSADDFATPPASGLRVTWLGHSTTLIEIEGRTILFDPVWSDAVSPSSLFGPARFHAPPLPFDELPALDAVIISHDHYDHLDTGTVDQLAAVGVDWIVPLGVGAHLEYWDVPAERITELDWWEETEVSGLRVVATPSRHFSGRALLDRDRTLWAGWALVGAERRVFFSGDTGMFPGFAEIGERLGPFDVTLIETGAYNQLWRDVHLGPEQAVAAHQLVRGELYIPVHWGTFDLALHGWTEPAERAIAAARAANVAVAVPQPGQQIEPDHAPDVVAWWPDESWQSADEAPVIASGLD